MVSPTALLIAITLITTPPEIPEPLPDVEQWPEMQQALVQTAQEWELLDERETRYIFSRIEDFQDNLDLIRKRNRDLKDAPKLADAQRFPYHRDASEALAFNRSYWRYLENSLPLNHDRSEPIREAMRETDQLYKVWEAVKDARCEYYYVSVRRAALKKLKELIGDDDFWTGTLPPFVPIWRFREE